MRLAKNTISPSEKEMPVYKTKPQDNLLSEPDRRSAFQPEFMPVMAAGLKQLKALAGRQFHSLYVSGEVLTRQASPESCTLVFTLVISSPLNLKQVSALNTVLWRIKASHTAIKDIEIQTASLSEIKDLSNIFYWGFFLKHCAVCIHGDDLSLTFGHFEASWEVAKAMNPKIQTSLNDAKKKIASAKQWSTQLHTTEVIASKLIHGAFGLVLHREGVWYETPAQCAEVFLKYYPDQALWVSRLFMLLERKPVKKRAVIHLLDNFGDWLVQEYQRIDRKIG